MSRPGAGWRRFARARQRSDRRNHGDPQAIAAAAMIGSPAFALRSADNTLTSVLMTKEDDGAP